MDLNVEVFGDELEVGRVYAGAAFARAALLASRDLSKEYMALCLWTSPVRMDLRVDVLVVDVDGEYAGNSSALRTLPESMDLREAILEDVLIEGW